MRNVGIDLKPPTKTCDDMHCPFHGVLGVRGRVFQGTAVSVAAPKTAVVQREYLHYIDKYMRYEKRRRRIRAHLPPCLEVTVGDQVTVGECRPLTKTVSFVVLERVPS
ncbi:MAG: 30S ribosomal protein S17 [Nitrososphaerales archaeon]|nr:30S ribosomal protein S17 [Nitrososphaerota archaeon]